MIQGEAGCMRQLKLWIFFICFALGFDSSEGKKNVVWIEPMLCVGWPQIFGKTPYTAKKKIFLSFKGSFPYQSSRPTCDCISSPVWIPAVGVTRHAPYTHIAAPGCNHMRETRATTPPWILRFMRHPAPHAHGARPFGFNI